MGKRLLPTTALALILTATMASAEPERDIAYSDAHPRNVLDYYPAKKTDAKKAAPVLVWFHGGGFKQGDKKGIQRGTAETMLNAHLDAGYAVVSCNYPLLDKKAGMDYADILPHCGRAVQFIRSQASDWNIDPNKVVAGGASAGALISEWLAYSDNMADKEADDTVKQQNSRANIAVAVMQPIGTEQMALPFMEKGEPPLFLYTKSPNSDRIHHPKYTKLIRDKAKALGIPCQAYGSRRNDLPNVPEGKSILDLQLAFCAKHLKL